jgi:hypothetical protein
MSESGEKKRWCYRNGWRWCSWRLGPFLGGWSCGGLLRYAEFMAWRAKIRAQSQRERDWAWREWSVTLVVFDRNPHGDEEST